MELRGAVASAAFLVLYLVVIMPGVTREADIAGPRASLWVAGSLVAGLALGLVLPLRPLVSMRRIGSTLWVAVLPVIGIAGILLVMVSLGPEARFFVWCALGCGILAQAVRLLRSAVRSSAEPAEDR